ncbi:MAG: hypothetical protein Q9183_007998, partial [Haloplaca sp. 2 TL-2023]
ISEAKSIDLNPTAPAPASAEPTAATTTSGEAAPKPTAINTATATNATVAGDSAGGEAPKKVDEGGMSATLAGPLDDQLEAGSLDGKAVPEGVKAEGPEKK